MKEHTDLEVRTGYRSRELTEESVLHFGKLGGVHDFEDVFYLVQEHDLFGTVDFWPVSE